MKMADVIRIHPADNVAVALSEQPSGSSVNINGTRIILRDAIPAGHKFAINTIHENEPVIKYGMPMGHAVSAIPAGSHIHTHNVKSSLGGCLNYEWQPESKQLPPPPAQNVFQGYEREDGQIGIRNEIWIIPTVGCVNKIAQNLAEALSKDLIAKSSAIDGCFAFPHPYGCSQLGDDHTATQRLLAGLIKHPNAAGVLVLGLGCENNTMASLMEVTGSCNPARVKTLIVQDVENEFDAGMQLLREIATHASKAVRTPVPVSKLKVGLKCGASDGLSGITANPLVGAFSDLLISAGGTTILTEVPEMFGAETILMNRCTDRKVFEKCVSMINHFKEYFTSHNQVVYENPSPGNKDGGITTLEEKSLGCIQKGGCAPVVDVLDYGDTVKHSGLNLLSGPGNDIVASTVLAAAGAHLVLFTTGRGTPLGCPVPTIKISTNSRLAELKPHWIDFNAGRLLEDADMSRMAAAFYNSVLEVASGKHTCSEKMGFREIAIFKDGVTL